MQTLPNRYVFRFIHFRVETHWTVKDTLSEALFGHYLSEAEAIAAALDATARSSQSAGPGNMTLPLV
jgi:hypothetical protein